MWLTRRPIGPRRRGAGRRLVAWENHVIPLSNQVACLVVDKRRQGRAL